MHAVVDLSLVLVLCVIVEAFNYIGGSYGLVEESIVLILWVDVDAFDLIVGSSGLVEDSNVNGKHETFESLVDGLQLIDTS